MTPGEHRRGASHRAPFGKLLLFGAFLILPGAILATYFAARLYAADIVYTAQPRIAGAQDTTRFPSLLNADRERVFAAVRDALVSTDQPFSENADVASISVERVLRRMVHFRSREDSRDWIARLEHPDPQLAVDIHNAAFRMLASEDGGGIRSGDNVYVVKAWATPNYTPCHPNVRRWLRYGAILAGFLLVPGLILINPSRGRPPPIVTRSSTPLSPKHNPKDPW